MASIAWNVNGGKLCITKHQTDVWGGYACLVLYFFYKKYQKIVGVQARAPMNRYRGYGNGARAAAPTPPLEMFTYRVSRARVVSVGIPGKFKTACFL